MPENLPKNSFAKLLRAFSANESEAAVLYSQTRDSLVRFFQLKGDIDPDEATDVTLDRVQLKLEQNIVVENISKYCFGVARFISLERFRLETRQKHAGLEFYADERKDEKDEENDGLALMKQCFDSLTDSEKEFLRSYFVDLPFSDQTAHRDQYAAKHNISVKSIRVRIFRLRQRLGNCVKEKLQS